jgi:hypothetical protein
MRVRLMAVLCVSLASVPRAASAQLYETVGIRAQGMGGAFVAVADDATATWWNPAGLATGPLFDALVEYGRFRTSPQTSSQGVAMAFPSLGISYYRLPLGGSREQHLGVYGLTFGQSLSNHVVVASTVKVEQAGETHGDIDIGLLARAGHAQLGISVKNVRETEFETGQGTLKLDRQARAGAALLGRSNGWIKELTLSFDADLIATRSQPDRDQIEIGSPDEGEVRYVAGGVELWVLNKRLGLRGGASRNTVGSKKSSASGGVSLAIRSGLYVDAQHTNGSDLRRRSWGVALRSTF